MLCGVVMDALFFLVVDGVFRLLEEGGLVRRFYIFFIVPSVRVERIFIM